MSNRARRQSSPSIASDRGRRSHSEPRSYSSEEVAADCGSAVLATTLLIVHSLVAVALLGAVTHQTLAAWATVDARPGSFFGRFRSLPSGSFANAGVLLSRASAPPSPLLYLYSPRHFTPHL